MKYTGRNLKYFIVGFLAIVNFFIWYAVFHEDRQGILTVAFLDVGQGDAIFIEAPNGNQILIDGGVNKKVLRQLTKVMPFYDRSIDVVVATHPDSDHINGLVSVLKSYSVDYFLESGVGNNTAVYKNLENLAPEKILARRGMKINIGRGVYLNILFPDRDVSGMDTNDASIVTRLVYGDSEFLLTGDSSQKIENYLTSLGGQNLQSDVLKVGHHGSKTSSGQYFVAAVDPDYAVLSYEKDNRYGHPHKEVLNIFEQFETKILGTAEEGNVVFKSDGKKVWLEK